MPWSCGAHLAVVKPLWEISVVSLDEVRSLLSTFTLLRMQLLTVNYVVVILPVLTAVAIFYSRYVCFLYCTD